MAQEVQELHPAVPAVQTVSHLDPDWSVGSLSVDKYSGLHIYSSKERKPVRLCPGSAPRALMGEPRV